MKAKKCLSIIMMLMSLTVGSGSLSAIPAMASQTSGYSLDFNKNNYTEKTLTVDGKEIKYRAYENVVDVKNPVDTKYEGMNIYIPEAYFDNESVGSYTANTAPIFLPNTVGAYLPGEPGKISDNSIDTTASTTAGVAKNGGAPDGGSEAAAVALSKGYVVAMPGARGRTLQDASGKYYGKDPAGIVDLKAAVRYLHYNDTAMPGDADKIISNGTSAGGAMSALLGATGNSSDYTSYLNEIGAADARDDIFASSDYCPITNLDNADAAYEWTYNGIKDYTSMKISFDNGQINRTEVANTMTTDQIKLSDELKKIFPTYLNSLGLKKSGGTALTLNANGNGTFKDYVKSYVIASAQKALDSGTDLSGLNWLTISGNKVTDIDFDKYNKYVGRGKAAPSFDSVDLSAAENGLFGTATVDAQHFTQFSQDNNTVSGATMADPTLIKMMNPMNYIGQQGVTTAPYFRIRYGSVDSNTSTAIEVILATKLQNSGSNVDFAIPWGIGHAGDYDLDELFAWADKICQAK